jgi:glycerol-3-phosphate dehydrogenase
VINATGVWVDTVRRWDGAPGDPAAPPLVSPSQGVHLVVDRAFLPTDHALLIPKTADGRVLFAVPWLGKPVLGTTDTPSDHADAEPTAQHQEVDFILREAGRYLSAAPTRQDVRSVWVGLRPLVRPATDLDGQPLTKTLSREHTVRVDRSGLVSVTGGKWTTYRAMAEDVLAQAARAGLLPARRAGATRHLALAGSPAGASAAAARSLTESPGAHLYGSDAPQLDRLPGARTWLWRDGAGGLTEAMVRFAARVESACTVEDVLARRSRVLFLDARCAGELARPVASILRDELGAGFDESASARAFETLAAHYLHVP